MCSELADLKASQFITWGYRFIGEASRKASCNGILFIYTEKEFGVLLPKIQFYCSTEIVFEPHIIRNKYRKPSK